jgi:methylglutaconyl-CoA hydratase
MTNPVLFYAQNQIGYVTLNRPEKRNALNPSMVSELKIALESFRNNENVKVVVLQAEGESFCAGADLAYLQQLQHNSYEENLADSQSLMELFKTILSFPKVVIAKVNGPAIAGGCGLATVCDFAFASDKASFGYSEVKIGFVPAIVMVFLAKKIGEAKARAMLLSGNNITASEAVQQGLINKHLAPNELDDFVEGFAQNLCKQNSSESMKMVKEMLIHMPQDYNTALKYAAEMNAKARGTSDCKKGISAFLNKEKIVW